LSRAIDAATIDTDFATLATDITTYLTDGGSPSAVSDWVVKKVSQLDQRIARHLQQNGSRVINSPPENRTFAAADNF
jgi:hypothetical protein